MERCVKISVVICVLLLLAGTAYAQHLREGSIVYHSLHYPPFYHGKGGLEAHSGAYIHLFANVTGYSQIRDIAIRAEHKGTGFTVSLREDAPECVGSQSEDVQAFSAFLGAEDGLVGEWEFTMQYIDSRGRNPKTEKATATVSSFNFPPHPTGIQIAQVETDQGLKTYLLWNKIGDPKNPSDYANSGVDCIVYAIFHISKWGCLDELLRFFPGGSWYENRSGNRIIVELPSYWHPGDRIRIENRIYGSDRTSGHPFDRGITYLILP